MVQQIKMTIIEIVTSVLISLYGRAGMPVSSITQILKFQDLTTKGVSTKEIRPLRSSLPRQSAIGRISIVSSIIPGLSFKSTTTNLGPPFCHSKNGKTEKSFSRVLIERPICSIEMSDRGQKSVITCREFRCLLVPMMLGEDLRPNTQRT